MSDALFAKILADLEKSGMRSELMARHAFTQAGWSVAGGAAYLDLDEGKSREIDMSATKTKGLFHNGMQCCYSEFSVIAEIKKSERPWVVFKKNKKEKLCAWNNIVNYINLPCKPGKLVNYLSAHSLAVANQWVGTGIHESFKSPDMPSRWYSAFVSVCKAAEGFSAAHNPDGESLAEDILKNPSEIYFIQPLVILDGQLVSAELDATGSIQLKEISSAAFTFEYRTKEYRRHNYRVDLVTLAGLADYLELADMRHASLIDGIRDVSPISLMRS